MNPIQRLGAALKSFSMVFASGSGRWWTQFLGRTRYDYAREVGTGRGNAALMACVLWFCRTFPEAPLRVCQVDAKGEDTPLPNHPLKLLLDTPNPYYSGELLWYGTLADWMLTGNAYWLKVRSGMGRTVELWWVPSTLMEPRWPDDGSAYLSHYDYTPNGVPIPYPPSEVVHFRYGLDPDNTRKGCSPITSLLREIFTDDEAANYTASMLRNVGVPPVIVSPKLDANGNGPKLDQAGADQVKDRFQELSTGDNRGQAIVMRGATDIHTLGFNPQQMDVKALRRVPEERISAIFGTPAVVVGLGAGLDRSTFSNMAEAREAAYESNVIPSQRLLAGELRTQLLPDFGTSTKLKIEFDLSQVRVLQADLNELHARARENLKAGLWTRNRALAEVGDEPEVEADVLYVPIGVTPTDPAELLAPPPPVVQQLPPGSPAQDGNQPALPAPKVFRLPTNRKAAGVDVGAGITRLRGRLQPVADRELTRFFQQQRTRIVERLEGTRKATPSDVPEPGDLFTPEEEARLRATLEAIQLRALDGMHTLTEDVLGIVFDLDDPTTRTFLAEAGVNIVGINETTLDAVRAALQAGQAEGESISQLAARIRMLPAFDQARATLVARTELGHAMNRAAVHSYRASGLVVGVQVLDGDYDEACAAMNGRTFTLDQAPDTLQHPRCTRAFLPLTDATQLEDAA